MKQNSKSILRLPAQIDILKLHNLKELIKYAPGVYVNLPLYRNDKLCYYIACLQSLYGFRISEVLNIRVKDYFDDYTVVVYRLKKEEKVRVDVSFQASLVESIIHDNVDLFAYTTRFLVYATYKRFHIKFDSIYSTKQSVTHSFRHELVKKYLSEGYSYSDIALLLGHSNERNTKLYGQGK